MAINAFSGHSHARSNARRHMRGRTVLRTIPATLRTIPATRAQTTGTGAAVLILLIAVLIIIYILFLPPQTRQELLDQPGTGQPGAVFRELLIASPGRIEVLDSGAIEHTLPAVNLFSSTQAAMLKSMPSLYVKRGWLDTQPSNFTFALENPAHTENLLLSFTPRHSRGRLIIRMNNYEIFNGAVGAVVEPIHLPAELVKEANVLLFEASDVGMKFWATNEHALESLKITGEITDVSTQEAKSVFHVTATEKNNVNRVFLKFLPDCIQSQIGVLEIFLNNHNIFSAVPDCGVLRSMELAPEYFISGENTLIFKTSKGVYVVDLISVNSQLREISYPSFYFEITPAVHDALLQGGVVELVLDFTNDIDLKRADLFVNGHARSISTTESSVTIPLTQIVAKGNNAVEIRPRTTLDIANVRVVAR